MTLSGTEQRLCDTIAGRASFLLADLRRHVELPTGGGNVDAIDETRGHFVSRLEALGATTTSTPGDPRPDWLSSGKKAAEPLPSTTSSRLVRDAAARVLIAGHLDTVHDPKGDFRELSVRPDGKTATGPGCVDMKGGLVIAVAALEALEECGVPCSWSFFLNADEETGTYFSERALRAQSREHDLGIALEPALPGGELAVERPGSGQFMIETRGRAAHVGRAFTEGVSAVNELARAILSVAEMPDPGNGRIVSIGPIEGGVATNAVPDRARAWGNVRFATPEIADDLGRMLDALATPVDAMPSVTVARSFNRPAKPLTPETEALADRARAAAEALGQKLPFARTGGVCDGNIMQDAGLPTIDTLGVRGGGLHTPDEWIDLSSLVERCQLLAVLLSRVAAGG